MTLHPVLIAFASYRVWRLIAVDQITEPLRAPLLRSDHRAAVWVYDLITCAWCAGFWISGAITGATALSLDWALLDAVLAWWAVSAVVGLLGRLDQA